jgi:RNA polymerase sigma-70 factor (ECF subfamily)
MTVIGPETLGQIYRQHAAALRLYARQWPGVAEDVVQEAFIRLARQTPPPLQVLPWLYRVVRNQALADQRAALRRRKREAELNPPETWFQRADERLEARDAARLLAELSLERREVIVARLWGGLTFEEVAQLVGCPLQTAHRRYRAGLAELRDRLENQWTPAPKAT